MGRRTKTEAPSSSRDGDILLLTRNTLGEGVRILRRRDPRLGRWLDLIGPVKLRRQRQRFGALCRSILAQQLGSGAARTIHARFLALFSAASPQPDELLELPESRLRAAGVSRPKIRYLRALAEEFHEGSLRNVRLARLPDDEVVRRLTRLPGIGVWTAEMFLIFSLGRLDVFSKGDHALRAGVERVVGRKLTTEEIVDVASRWAPYRSVASLYLWKIAHHERE